MSICYNEKISENSIFSMLNFTMNNFNYKIYENIFIQALQTLLNHYVQQVLPIAFEIFLHQKAHELNQYP